MTKIKGKRKKNVRENFFRPKRIFIDRINESRALVEFFSISMDNVSRKFNETEKNDTYDI